MEWERIAIVFARAEQASSALLKLRSESARRSTRRIKEHWSCRDIIRACKHSPVGLMQALAELRYQHMVFFPSQRAGGPWRGVRSPDSTNGRLSR